MVKTTVILEDELYKQLVKEALEKYGTTRKLSLLLNEKLKKLTPVKSETRRKWLTVKIGKKLTQRELERAEKEGWKEVIRWKV